MMNDEFLRLVSDFCFVLWSVVSWSRRLVVLFRG
jgi:hypothetical protein